MALPDAWLETSAPPKLPNWVVVSGRTFQRRYQILAGSPLAGVDLDGCTVAAEIVDRSGSTLVVLTATIHVEAEGWIKVRLEPDETEGLYFPADHPPKLNRGLIGRADVVITDGNGDRVSIAMADVELVRGESA